jgi:tetratricopeptide (TPR) repeat protein
VRQPRAQRHDRLQQVGQRIEEELWLTGDLFAPEAEPYVDSDRIAAFPRRLTTLERIVSSGATTKAIVPGHGKFLSIDDLRKTMAFVRAQQTLYAGRESGFAAFKTIHGRAGVEEALTALRRFRAEPGRYFLLHLEIDTYAYRLMNAGRLDEASKIFALLVEFFPGDWQAFDSLGEVQLKLGQASQAAESFRRSLALDPKNRNAIEKLKTLEKGKSDLPRTTATTAREGCPSVLRGLRPQPLRRPSCLT